MSQYTVSVKYNLRTELEPTVSGLQVGGFLSGGTQFDDTRKNVGWVGRQITSRSIFPAKT